VSKDRFASGFDFLQHAEIAELLEINRYGLTFRDTGFNEISDAAVRLLEQDFHQFPSVGFRQFHLYEFSRVFHEFAYCLDLVSGPFAGFFDSIEDEHDPGCLVLLVSYVFQQAVVGCLITDDLAAQVQDWGVEQSVFDQEENVQDSAGTAVAICEWMDGFELVILHRGMLTTDMLS
jgi:hypothetical protein